MRTLLMSLMFILFLPSICKSDENPNYGWKIPHTPLFVGGYLSAKYDKEERNDLVFDDIALLFYTNAEKYHILGEIEASDIPLQGGQNSDIRIFIERMQLSYDINEYSTMTIGKFNSDIGFWNLAPINTLTDTSSSPYLMEATFPELTTGFLYTRSFAQEEKIFSLTIQHNPDIDKQYNNMHIDRHYAIGYTYFGMTYTWRLNGGYFHDRDESNAFYAGVSYQKESNLWTIQSEVFSKQTNNDKDIPYNAYIQLTKHITNKHDLVFRQEFYKDEAINVQEGISLIGYAYRPRPFIAIKGEYVKHSSLPQNRFIFSFSVVF